MADFFNESSTLLVFINLLMVYALYKLTSPALKYPYTLASSKRKAAIVLTLLFVIFSFWGADWFHYREGYQDLIKGDVGHMESIYGWIAQHLSIDYLTFRLVVWGSALIMLNHTIKKLPIRYDLALCLFCSIWLIWFSYARASVAMTCIFLATSLFLYSDSKLYIKVCALAMMVTSIFFHKTALFGIVCVILAYSIHKLPKYITLFILIVGVIFLYLNLSSLLSDFVSISVDNEDGGFSNNVAVGQYYLNSENLGASGIGDRIAKLLEQVSYYATLFCCILFYRSNTKANISESLNIFITSFVIIVIFSSVFYLDFGFYTRTLATRFMRFAMIPSVVVMSYFIEKGFKPRLTKIVIIISLLSTFYSLGYSFYCHF